MLVRQEPPANPPAGVLVAASQVWYNRHTVGIPPTHYRRYPMAIPSVPVAAVESAIDTWERSPSLQRIFPDRQQYLDSLPPSRWVAAAGGGWCHESY